jgi:hypothetical protein
MPLSCAMFYCKSELKRRSSQRRRFRYNFTSKIRTIRLTGSWPVEGPPLFVQQALPICRDGPRWSGCGLIQRMANRGGELRSCEHLSRTVVVEPMLTRLKAHDDRMARGGVVLRGVLVWRSVAAADVPALRASAKMQPPCALSQAFDATRSARLGCWVDTVSYGLRTLHVSHQKSVVQLSRR